MAGKTNDHLETPRWIRSRAALGGACSGVSAHTICRIQDLAPESGIPIIALNDSGGSRVEERLRRLAGEVLREHHDPLQVRP
jgi:acetyl-CoA carboxylase carboxyltransferase component